MRYQLFVALAFSLVLTGCSANKKVEKGTDDKVILGTKSDNSVPANQQRPTVTAPPDAGSRAPGKDGTPPPR